MHFLKIGKVLLMQWNGCFDFGKREFQFLDMFSGASHTSRVWSGT